MNDNEIVRELGHRADAANKRGYSGEASEWLELADLIESLQAQLITTKSDLDRANGKIQGMTEGVGLLKAQLAASQRRERAAVEDMKLIVDAVREAHCDETCCFACKFDCDTSITDSGCYANECPGFERDDCFEWRGAKEERK